VVDIRGGLVGEIRVRDPLPSNACTLSLVAQQLWRVGKDFVENVKALSFFFLNACSLEGACTV